MRLTEKTTVEIDVVTDILCDFCGKSTNNGANFSYGELTFTGCYGSDHDLEGYELVLCETCLFEIIDKRVSGEMRYVRI